MKDLIGLMIDFLKKDSAALVKAAEKPDLKADIVKLFAGTAAAEKLVIARLTRARRDLVD